MSESPKRFVILTTVAANIAVAIAKFVAAMVTHSSGMLSEGIHSVVDTGDGLLLMLGHRRARRPPDDEHPFGHGLELYFWSLMVAVLIFGAGGGVSIYEGILHVMHPEPIRSAGWSYAVLAVSFVFEASAWYIALRDVRRENRKLGVVGNMRATKDPTSFTALMENTADLAGILVAAGGVVMAHEFHHPRFDGIASILIGVILCAVATFLIWETRGLMLGEAADRATVQSVRALASNDAAVEKVRRPLTMHFGPNEVLLNLELEFRPSLTAAEVAAAVERIERVIRSRHPEIRRIYVEGKALTRPA